MEGAYLMKQPKEPKEFNYPRLYARILDRGGDYVQRLRIIYPDGKCEYTDMKYLETVSHDWYIPCWRSPNSGPHIQVLKMKAYDAQFGLRTQFLGEIK